MTEDNSIAPPRIVAWLGYGRSSALSPIACKRGAWPRQATLPGWYLPLRMRLSTVAVICLVAGIFASVV